MLKLKKWQIVFQKSVFKVVICSSNNYLDLIRNLFKSKKKDNMYGYVKFDLGEEVKVIIYSENSDHWYIEEIIDINYRYVVSSLNGK